MWTGWIYFAGIMAIVIGVFDVLQGLAAIFDDEYFAVTSAGLLVFDFTTWGVITLILGILLILIGAGLFSANGLARWGAVVIVTLNMAAQVAFLAAFPLWGIVTIAISVLVLYALVVRWDENLELAGKR